MVDKEKKGQTAVVAIEACYVGKLIADFLSTCFRLSRLDAKAGTLVTSRLKVSR